MLVVGRKTVEISTVGVSEGKVVIVERDIGVQRRLILSSFEVGWLGGVLSRIHAFQRRGLYAVLRGGSRRLEIRRKHNRRGEFMVISVHSSTDRGVICIPESEFGTGWRDLANALTGFDLGGSCSRKLARNELRGSTDQREDAGCGGEVIPSSCTVISFLRDRCLVGTLENWKGAVPRAKEVEDENKPATVWVRVLGLPVFLWSEELLRVLGDRCGGYITMAEETAHRDQLQWARICVRGMGASISATLTVGMGSLAYTCPIWVESGARVVRRSEPTRYSDGARWREAMGKETDGERNGKFTDNTRGREGEVHFEKKDYYPNRADHGPAKFAEKASLNTEKARVSELAAKQGEWERLSGRMGLNGSLGPNFSNRFVGLNGHGPSKWVGFIGGGGRPNKRYLEVLENRAQEVQHKGIWKESWALYQAHKVWPINKMSGDVAVLSEEQSIWANCKEGSNSTQNTLSGSVGDGSSREAISSRPGSKGGTSPTISREVQAEEVADVMIEASGQRQEWATKEAHSDSQSTDEHREGVELAMVLLEGNQIEPLATIDPGDEASKQADESDGSSDRGEEGVRSVWARKKLKGFGKFLGISYGGVEEEAVRLFARIEQQWKEIRRTATYGHLLVPITDAIDWGCGKNWRGSGRRGEFRGYVGGDFNVVRFSHERVGSTASLNAMRDFSEYINEEELIDLPLEDHNPLFLAGGGMSSGSAPFRFENMWLQVEGFKDLITKWWQGYSVYGSPSYCLARKLRLLKEDLKRWNIEIYGRVETRLANLTEELKVLESKKNSPGLSDGERDRRMELKAEIGSLLIEEETSWRQKSRAIWLAEGDRNTGFFHRMANAHRRLNFIGRISVEGVIHEGQDSVANGIVGFYDKQFKEPEQWRPRVDGLSLPSLNLEETDSLVRPFGEEEVSEMLMGMKGDKAPGPDGFSIAFLQHCWLVIKDDIMAVFEQVHAEGDFEKSLNATFIVLIPKKNGALDIGDYKPISLIGCIYKVLAKVLARRMAKVMDRLISANQNAFVGGRQILDASLVANECVDGRLKSKESGVPCKLDIEKAYDHVNWDQAQGFIGGSRGLRQGDPLSPFLFIIVMDVLSRFIGRAVYSDRLSGFKVGKGNQAEVVSHLLFADDTLIFCKADSGEMACLRDILLCFQAVSGLKINLAKSELIQDQRKTRVSIWWPGGFCLPKKGGGLGIRDLGLFNKALLGKWIWRFALGEDKMWCRVIKGKYGCERGDWRTKDIAQPHGTGLWKGIMKVWGDFYPQVKYQLGNGSRIRFWHDDWCYQMPLRARFLDLFALASDQDASVVDCWTHSSAGGVGILCLGGGPKTGRWKSSWIYLGCFKDGTPLVRKGLSGGGKTKEMDGSQWLRSTTPSWGWGTPISLRKEYGFVKCHQRLDVGEIRGQSGVPFLYACSGAFGERGILERLRIRKILSFS
ncbi:hypothetical protein Acr_24g0008090 [Actinidia rufa]|uniref:Reverse transcriptase domain-containing protein n=1 Tax=Actinidia rufa TaxID=165716 RepID=A0A7J0GUU9_9ERIC|nr:hypothetical protein Acr_24g0008090 [Actinidia rufa]